MHGDGARSRLAGVARVLHASQVCVQRQIAAVVAKQLRMAWYAPEAAIHGVGPVAMVHSNRSVYCCLHPFGERHGTIWNAQMRIFTEMATPRMVRKGMHVFFVVFSAEFVSFCVSFGFVLGTDFDLEKFFFFCTVDQICQFGRFGQTMSKTMPNIFLEWVSAQNFKKGLEVDFWWSELEITHLPGSSCFSVIKNNFFLEFSITQKFSLTSVNGGINLKEIFNEY